MSPIYPQHQIVDSHHMAHAAAWDGSSRQPRPSAPYAHQHQQHQQDQHQWPVQGPLHINNPAAAGMVRDDGFAAAPPMQHPSLPVSRHHLHATSRDVLSDGSFMGRGYSIKRCQGFVRCDMDIDAEVVGWVIGKNGSTIKDMKIKTGCNMWVDQRALKLTITGPDLACVEHAAKSVDAYVAAAPIKAGAVEAAVTKTLDCPPQLLDDLGDRTTIARIVKETHAQVVVNKKIGRIIVRGDVRSVELASASVQVMITNALNGNYGLDLRVNTPDSHGSYGGGGYFPDGSISNRRSGGGGGASPGMGMHHMMPPSSSGESHTSAPHFRDDNHHRPRSAVTPEFRHLAPWQQEQQLLELKGDLSCQQQQPLHRGHQHHHQHHHGRGGGSDSDESEIETVSLVSMGARTPVSSTAGSPRVAASYTTSPALSAMASTPIGDWSLFSGGFGLGVAALEGESSSRSSTPTASITTRVHFPEGLHALGEGGDDSISGGSDDGRASAAPIEGATGLLSPSTRAASAPNEASLSAAAHGRGKPMGSRAPPPSPASAAGGDMSHRPRSLPVPEARVLSLLEGEEADDDDQEDAETRSVAAGGDGAQDVAEKVARLGKLLQAMGLGKYCEKFANNEVDLEALGLMSEGDLADIGIPKGPRLKILNAVGARAAAAANHAPAV